MEGCARLNVWGGYLGVRILPFFFFFLQLFCKFENVLSDKLRREGGFTDAGTGIPLVAFVDRIQ